MTMGLNVFITANNGELVAPPWCLCEQPCCFREPYGKRNLIQWLRYQNIERDRKSWVMPIFDPRRQLFNTDAWREELVNTAKFYYEQALQVRGEHLWNQDKSKEVLPPHETEYYILWVKRLLEFAKLVRKQQATVGVWGAVPY